MAYLLRGVAALLLACAAALSVAPAPSRPNIVLIVVDTLRADRIDRILPDGNRLMPSTGLLAERSIRYQAARAAAPMTMPSMAALLTGRYPDRTGVITHSRATSLSPATPTLAELARDAGYATVAVVANPWLASDATGFSRGFATYLTKRELRAGGTRLEAAAVTDAAIAAMHSATPPLFLWAHYIDAHMPYQPPRSDAELLRVPDASSAVVRDYVDDKTDRQAIYFSPSYPRVEIDATRALYDAAARSVDREVGRLLTSVEATLGMENTLVIFTADHGEALGEHGLWFAHDFTLYRELTHVPLLVMAPRHPAARVSSPVSLVDVAPTVCGLARLPCAEDMDGRVLPFGEPQASTEPVFSIGPPYRERYDRNPYIRVRGIEGRWSALRENGSTLLRIPTEAGVRWERYDVDTDPGELRNVFDAQRDAADVRRLEEWLASQARARVLPADRRSTGAWRHGDVRDLRALGYLD